MKLCKTCGIEKEDTEFYPYAGYTCKTCCSERSRSRAIQLKKVTLRTTCSRCGKPKRGESELCGHCRKSTSLDRRLLRMEIKKKAVDLLGGKCNKCGIIDPTLVIYDFHHESGEEKEKEISAYSSWGMVKKELTKCVLVCSNCHRLIHYVDPKCDERYEEFYSGDTRTAILDYYRSGSSISELVREFKLTKRVIRRIVGDITSNS